MYFKHCYSFVYLTHSLRHVKKKRYKLVSDANDRKSMDQYNPRTCYGHVINFKEECEIFFDL